MEYVEGMEKATISEKPTIEWFPEIQIEDLLSKYGPEGLYDIAKLLTKRADEDVSDAINDSINY